MEAREPFPLALPKSGFEVSALKLRPNRGGDRCFRAWADFPEFQRAAPRTAVSAALCRSPPVQQRSPSARNSAASFLVVGRENGTDLRRCSDDHGAAPSIAHRHGPATPAWPLPLSDGCDRRGSGQRRDAGSSGHCIGHSRAVVCSALSTCLAVERWKTGISLPQ